jgi:hypothetical protein
MALNSTYYPNNQRVIAGTATLYQSDCVLLCDTSLAAVSFTLLEIPSDYWETTWKLYVVDNSGNSATNNITINAPTGYTINGSSSLVINSNGGVCVVTVSSNTKFLGVLSYTTGGGGNIAVLSDGTPVTSAATSFDFASVFNVTATGGAVSIDMYDTGWVNLLNFDQYYTGTMAANQPQCRRIGKQIFFRGAVYIPIADPAIPSNVKLLSSSTAYNSVASSTPFTGTPAGVLIGDDGELTMNNNSSIIPTSVLPALTTLDGTYSTGWIIATRQCNIATNYGTSFSAPFNIAITSAKKLIVSTIYDVEFSSSATLGFVGSNPLRLITSNIGTDQFLPNFINPNTTGFNHGAGIGIEFTITAGNANVGDIYRISPSTSDYEVVESINGGTILKCIASGKPSSSSGTLTRFSGTGDATLTYSAYTQIAQQALVSTQQYGIASTAAPYTYSAITSGTYGGSFDFTFNIDGGNPNTIGGFVFRLDGLTAFIA